MAGMDPINFNPGAPLGLRRQAPVEIDNGPAPGPGPGPGEDRVTVSPAETEKSAGNIPNFGATQPDKNGNAAGDKGNPSAPGEANGNANGQANGLDPSGMPKASAQDEEMARHVCAKGCGCISTNGGSGTNPLKVLEERDQEVRAHEQEHLNEAGEHARGGPVFETYTASNGKTFVTGGKVEVDMGETGDAKKTADKMAKIRKAALAPATPSQQDRAVEAEAAGKESTARAQMQQDDIKKGRDPAPV